MTSMRIGVTQGIEWKRWLLAAVGAMMMAACADQPQNVSVTYYGTIESIQVTHQGDSNPINVGTVVGGIAGAVIGYQFGGGVGKGLATAGGALGGALVGNAIQKSQDKDRYQIVVRLDNGGTLSVSEVDQGELRVGDHVRVTNNRVYRN
jgi:outer membrane lipoprotein SlyB